VDNTKQLPTELSFCTGYGGIELGLKRAIGGVNTLAYVEIEAFAIANLVDKMEKELLVPAPVWTNIFIGYSINFVANILILPLFGFNTLTVKKNLILGVIYTGISLTRSYCVRRWFNKND